MAPGELRARGAVSGGGPSIDHVPGEPEASGFAHGRRLGAILNEPFVEAYLGVLGGVIGFDRDDLSAQAARWFARLPAQFRAEMAGMGAGAGLGTPRVAEFLFADIARPTSSGASPTASLSATADIGGPMCSAVIGRLDDGATWIGRNCDWLVPTLLRGTAVVVHETPHRIPVAAVGIRGDIDVDTGLNAERVWLHLHTLHARDDPPRDRTCISWLFWAREALETCASLDELERFIGATGRDRGVLAISGDGKTGEAAIFECSRSGHVRHDEDPARPVCATNHTLTRSYGGGGGRGAPGGTIGRYRALRARLDAAPPSSGPRDLIGLLGADGVEMRRRAWLRTIYSAVVRPSDSSLWFAAGGADGTPAASGGRWVPVPVDCWSGGDAHGR